MIKRLISFLVCLFVGFNFFGEEKKLFDATVKADLNGYDWVKSFEITSDSGSFSKKDLIILEPNEKGLRFAALNPPMNNSCNYKILTGYPSFLNGEIEGAGVISNVGMIKSIKVVYSTNRPYDEVFLMYSTSLKENAEIKYVKIPSDPYTTKSMEEREFIFYNPNYEEDVRKREIKNMPIVGNDTNNLFFRGIKIQTNAANGYSAYSPYSIFYLKEISVIYDKAELEENIEIKKQMENDFLFDNKTETIKQKSIKKIENREKIRTTLSTLKAE